jgi:hypothetical protein
MSDPLTDRLDQIEARATAATEGPWRALTTGPGGGDHWYVVDNGESIALVHANDGIDEDQREPDATFIAAAREDVPALIAALREVLALAKNHDADEGSGDERIPSSAYVTAVASALGVTV